MRYVGTGDKFTRKGRHLTNCAYVAKYLFRDNALSGSRLPLLVAVRRHGFVKNLGRLDAIRRLCLLRADPFEGVEDLVGVSLHIANEAARFGDVGSQKVSLRV